MNVPVPVNGSRILTFLSLNFLLGISSIILLNKSICMPIANLHLLIYLKIQKKTMLWKSAKKHSRQLRREANHSECAHQK